jgi:hypothetical protein
MVGIIAYDVFSQIDNVVAAMIVILVNITAEDSMIVLPIANAKVPFCPRSSGKSTIDSNAVLQREGSVAVVISVVWRNVRIMNTLFDPDLVATYSFV